MNFKKFTLVLIILIALSLTAVSATDNITDNVAANDLNQDSQTDEVLSVDVTGNTVTDIQKVIDNAKEGDTVNLGNNRQYDISDQSISINKKITLAGDNVTITSNSTRGAVSVTYASDVTIRGINFVNPVDLPKFGDSNFSGKAIDVMGSNNILIDNCKFVNYWMGIEMHSTSYSTVKNSWFNGMTTSVAGMAGSGTKAIQLMGSNNINVLNNTFYGQIYDSLSIASGSSYVDIEDNYFINNTFAIFYGGSSTRGGKIKNNTFITCGMINETYYNANLKLNDTVAYSNLPYIGMQKSSNNIEITKNTFIVKDNNRIIYSEAENTAHGFPSVIGAINITDNTVKRYDESVNNESVIFYHLKIVTSLTIDPTDDIVLKNNDFSDIQGIDNFHLEFASLKVNETNGDVIIPKSKLSTYFSIVDVEDGKVVLELNDANGVAVSGVRVEYTLNGVKTVSSTDEYGHIYINDLNGLTKIEAKFTGNALYSLSTLKSTVKTSKATATTTTPAKTSTVKATTLSIAKKTFKKKATKKISATLKSSGKAVKGKKITFKVNGKTYKATTNAKGVATVKVKLTKKGTFKYTAKFAGDSAYKAVSKTNKIIIK